MNYIQLRNYIHKMAHNLATKYFQNSVKKTFSFMIIFGKKINDSVINFHPLALFVTLFFSGGFSYYKSIYQEQIKWIEFRGKAIVVNFHKKYLEMSALLNVSWVQHFGRFPATGTKLSLIPFINIVIGWTRQNSELTICQISRGNFSLFTKFVVWWW